jgi:ceramide glucosyltransferase
VIVFEIVIGALVAGSWVYCVLGVVAALAQRRNEEFHGASRHLLPPGSPGPPQTAAEIEPNARAACPGISVLKPLSGIENGLEENLRTFFEQQYPDFELLFAVRESSDPAVDLVERLQAEYPLVASRLIVTGEPPYANAKVFSLSRMTPVAAHDVLITSDSDVRASAGFLERIAHELEQDRYDLATCPYRAVPGPHIWSLLEVLGINTEFWGGAFVAKLVEGVRFTIGPTVVARRKIFDAIPWDSLSLYLAEDFMLGQRAAELGFRVDLSQVLVEHHLGDDSLKENFSHRLRWARSTRRSRPWGYIGQIFTNPLPLAILFVAIAPKLWLVLVITLFLRALTAYATAGLVLHDPLCRRWWFLIPLQDLLSFVFWWAGFSGNRISWRGRTYLLRADGTFELVA